MALIDFDGFDITNSIVVGGRWTTLNLPAWSSSHQRFAAPTGYAGQGIRLTNTGHFLWKYMTSARSGTHILGVALKVVSLTNPTTTTTHYPIFTIMADGGTASQLCLCFTQNYALSIVRGAHQNTVIATSAINAVPLNDWCYVEFKFTISNSILADECVVKVTPSSGVASTEVLNLAAGTDTQNHASLSTFDQISLGGNNTGPNAAGATWDLDDFYWVDTTGPSLNDFLGEQRVLTRMPTNNGTYSQMSGSDGNSTNNFQLVDEINPNGNDYVFSNTIGQKDTYTFTALPATVNTINAINVLVAGQKDSVGTRQIASTIRMGGADYDSSSMYLSSSLLYRVFQYTVRPTDSTAWTPTDINNAEFGIKVVG